MTPSAGTTDEAAAHVSAVLARYRPSVLNAMRAALDRPGVEHLRYLRYHLGWEDAEGNPQPPAAGKMLRPALCLLCCEAAGGSTERALPAAAAIELLHNFTLIHDDIEDGSETRHSRPTLWRVAGVPQAINAGDGMFVLARRTLLGLREAGVPDGRVLDAARLLDDACIALCEGQYADIGFETLRSVTPAEYEAMIAGKTAALIAAACAIGAIAGGADDATAAAFRECGRRLGLAFQIQDDVLGVWGEVSRTGKPVADDVRSRKKSFPVMHAVATLDAARRDELLRLYAGDTMSERDVESAIALLGAAGARAAGTAAARGHAAAAIEALRPLPIDDARRRDIEAIAGYFVSRQA